MAPNSRCGQRRVAVRDSRSSAAGTRPRRNSPPKHTVVMHRINTLVTAAWFGFVATAPLIAQPSLSPKAKADSAKTPAPLFTRKDLFAAGIFAVGTVAM